LTLAHTGTNIHSVTTTHGEAIPISRRRDRRAELVDAAIRLFAERTYAATPVPLVAAEAGVGTGTLYRYFPSKEALGNAAFQRAKSRFLEGLADLDSEYADPRALFSAWWKALFRFALDHPAELAFLEHQQHAGYLDAQSRALAGDVDAAAVRALTSAQQSGHVRDGDAALLVALVFGAFIGLDRQARAGLLVLDDHTRETTEAVVWDLLRGPAATREDSA
jgi:AcrR family transcriptional regulator